MKRIALTLIVILPVLVSWPLPCFATSCDVLLSSADGASAVLKELFEDKVLSTQDLIAIRQGQNPLVAKQSSAAHLFVGAVTIALNELTKSLKSRDQLDVLIKQLETDHRAQNVQVAGTETQYLPIEFVNIKRGHFMMGSDTEGWGQNKQRRHPVEIIKDFRIANVPLTQWQYAFVMRENPSRFRDGDGSAQIAIGSNAILMNPNHPVERVTVEAESEFLSTINGWSKQNNPLIYKILANHIPYAHIRLPTEEEWEYVARNRGAWREFPASLDGNNFLDYMWIRNNSQRQTHAVADRQPLVLEGGQCVYDLFGNIYERTSNTDRSALGSMGRVVRGGSFWSLEHEIKSNWRHFDDEYRASEQTGIRLAEDFLR